MILKSTTRRRFLSNSIKVATGSAVSTYAPYSFAKKKTVLRVLGTHVTLQEELRKQAMQDLGIEIVFEPKGSATVLQKAASSPQSFDIYEQWSNSIHILWQAKAIQKIDINRIDKWKDINSLAKTGKVAPQANYGAGDAPYKILYVQKDSSLGPKPTSDVSFMPYVHNVDSFGYNTNLIPRGVQYETESWGWLLDEKHKGKVALINAPTIGIFDAALAAQAKGLMTFKDIGNMSTEEIDKLFNILTEKKQEGHFSGFWSSVPQSVDFMVKKRVHIESMFSPGVSQAKAQGIPVAYAAPKEGYRAWHGVMCLSSKAEGHTKDAAYDYMNWWLSGWPGSFIAKQGYYISNPQQSEPLLPKEEWDFWYNGKPAVTDLRGPTGQVTIKKGEIRDGGSYIRRFSHIAVWNTVMDNYDYSLDKWYEFLNS